MLFDALLERLVALVLLGVLAIVPAHASAQAPSASDLVEIEDPALRLETWLAFDAQGANTPRIVSGLSAGVGLVLTGLAIAIGLHVESWGLADAFTPLLVIGGGLGLVVSGASIATLVTPAASESRYARWRAIRARGTPSERDIARFEGELIGEMELQRALRPITFGGGLGLMLAGGIALGLTAAYARDELARSLGYSAGGAAAACGILFSTVVWLETPQEQRWRVYQDGFAPRSVQIAPLAARDVGGFLLSGTF